MGAPDLAALIDATWPPARHIPLGPFLLRDGQGGGKRVSAATQMAREFAPQDLTAAETAMRALGQDALFAIWPQKNAALDAALAQLGYRLVDPVVAYLGKARAVLDQGRDISQTYTHWPPLAITRQFWQKAGIGPARLAVMGRVAPPKTAIAARRGDEIAGLCFVALQGDTAMVHALEVGAAHRQQGVAMALLARAAHWADLQGAGQLAVVVTQSNAPARALYEKVGMVVQADYHYRQRAAQ